MWPFIKKKQFNVVIEGTSQDEWGRLNYKVMELEVPEKTTTVYDGSYHYVLFGRTRDFQTIERITSQPESLETKTERLSSCQGVALPYHGGSFPNVLERPRTLCLNDGRVYVDKGMLKDTQYVGAVSEIIKTAGELFQDKEAAKLYRKVA